MCAPRSSARLTTGQAAPLAAQTELGREAGVGSHRDRSSLPTQRRASSSSASARPTPCASASTHAAARPAHSRPPRTARATLTHSLSLSITWVHTTSVSAKLGLVICPRPPSPRRFTSTFLHSRAARSSLPASPIRLIPAGGSVSTAWWIAMRLHTRQYAHQASKHREHSTLQRPLSRHLTNPLDEWMITDRPSIHRSGSVKAAECSGVVCSFLAHRLRLVWRAT
eukprot:COSAG06_NODE_753_length_12547_cov_928.116244_8_plen_225_part_00